tara:strand:- start:604 stop:744 length:141 start_codon:yes stop_codon:yes gene_type:complete
MFQAWNQTQQGIPKGNFQAMVAREFGWTLEEANLRTAHLFKQYLTE